MDKISCFGAYGFVLGEFCREFPDQIIRIPKHDIAPQTKTILYGISTTDNYQIFDSPTLDVETNLMHLMEVLDACHRMYGKAFEFNFASSWFVYGSGATKEAPFTETSPYNPKGTYSITKACAEQMLITYCAAFGIPHRIMRFANVLGGRDTKVSQKKNALQYLIDKLIHNEDVELHDGGRFYRDYIDVRDLARAIKLVMSAPVNQIYNISNGVSYQFKDLINMAIKFSGSKSNVWDKLVGFNPEINNDVFLSNDKLKSLGYSPKYTIEQTLKDIIEFYEGKNG